MRKLNNNEIIGLVYIGSAVSVGLIGLMVTLNILFFFQLFFGVIGSITIAILIIVIVSQEQIREIEREKERQERMKTRLDILQKAEAILRDSRIRPDALEDKVAEAETKVASESADFADDN